MSTSSRKRRITIITDTAQHLGPYLAKEMTQRDHDLVISDPNVGIKDVESSAPDLVNELRSMGTTVEVVDIRECGREECDATKF